MDEYRALLEVMLGLQRPLEAKLRDLDWSLMGIDYSIRQKSSWIEADLRDLGHDDHSLGTVTSCIGLPKLQGVETGMGWLYTLEGATLGGRFILQDAERRLGVSPLLGGRYFAGYADKTAAMWRQFTLCLNAIDPHTARADAVEEGACDIFHLFERWFARAPVADNAKDSNINDRSAAFGQRMLLP